MGPQSPARHRRLSARPCAPAELPELGASTAAEGRGAARGRAAERRWRSASRSADRPRLPPGKLKASFTMRTRENRTAASRGGGPWGGGGEIRRRNPRQPSERRSRSKRSNAYTFNTTISILHTHASQPRSSEETGRHRDSTVRVLLLGTLYARRSGRLPPLPASRHAHYSI